MCMWEGGEGEVHVGRWGGRERCKWEGGEGERCARSLLEEASSQAHFLFLHVGGKRNRAWDEATSSLPSYMSREQVNLYPSFPHEPGDKARVEVLSLPHLTNNSDTLIGVQIDNCRRETRALNPAAHAHMREVRSQRFTSGTVHVHGRGCMYQISYNILHVASIIQYIYVNTWLMFMR